MTDTGKLLVQAMVIGALAIGGGLATYAMQQPAAIPVAPPDPQSFTVPDPTGIAVSDL